VLADEEVTNSTHLVMKVIRRCDLLHAFAGINGQDIARPAEILVDSSGAICWANLAEDYRVRAP
jgi:hypothetical protein